jgi:pyrroline-5-carboxylate reductase
VAAQRETIAIVGAGNMGLALARGLLATDPSVRRRLWLSGRDAAHVRKAAEALRVGSKPTNREVVRLASTVVLAVKPQILPTVLDEIRGEVSAGTTVVSIAAGVPTTTLESKLGPKVGVVRAMPNVAASVRASATAYCLGASGRPTDRRRARSILESVGTVVEVDESLMDAVTGLSGTGPLYLFLILEGLSDAGVKVGLSRATATQLATQTLAGSAEMVRATGEHPAKLRDLVTSPGGTAITALHSLEKSGLKAMLLDAVEAATRRSAELGLRWQTPPAPVRPTDLTR